MVVRIKVDDDSTQISGRNVAFSEMYTCLLNSQYTYSHYNR